jgi:hypothetical protein
MLDQRVFDAGEDIVSHYQIGRIPFGREPCPESFPEELADDRDPELLGESGGAGGGLDPQTGNTGGEIVLQ